jgi:hypothetical protein
LTGSFGVYGAYQKFEDDGANALTSIGLAGHYKVTPDITVFAGLSSFDGVEGDLIEGGGIGASYEITGALSGQPLVLSGEYRSFSGLNGDDTIDGFSLMLTVPFGDADGILPTDSVAGAVASPGFSSFATVYDSLY